MKGKWISATITAACLSVFVVNGARGADMGMAKPGSQEFKRVKSLVGSWEGTSSSQTHGEQPAKVDYRLTSGGSALVETLFAGTPHEMMSIYHDRAGVLTMTHYCMLGNQPELDLTKGKSDQLTLEFSPRSAIDEAREPHMHALTVTFVDADHITQEWIFYEGGVAKDVTKITLSRVK